MEELNQVRLIGRVAETPGEVRLPSGDVVCTVRVIVRRPPGAASGRRGASVDAVECSAWSARVQRSVRGWRAGDVVSVEGALRRRFFRRGGSAESRVEVELATGRVIRRAKSA